VGVIAFVQRQSLMGEVLSHAAYPGMIVGLFALFSLGLMEEDALVIFIFLGAFLFSLLGGYVLNMIEVKFKMNKDAALCLVLSSFLGIGAVLSSRMQILSPRAMKQISTFLCGQAAIMTDLHVYLYFSLALLISLFILLFFRQIRAICFDRDFAKLKGYSLVWIHRSILILISLAVIVGLQGVGVVLMAGMLIAPAIAARFLTNRLALMFPIAAIVGALSGFLGNVFSIYLSDYYNLALPTGPMILITAALFAFISSLSAPKQGLIVRFSRLMAFRFRSLRENILKFLWRKKKATFSEIQSAHHISWLFLWSILQFMKWRKQIDGSYALTPKGRQRAEYIVRLHRLCELYLHSYLGMSGEKVHLEAEEMEHVITPEIEEELTMLLDNPEKDPHNQPIPKKRGKE